MTTDAATIAIPAPLIGLHEPCRVHNYRIKRGDVYEPGVVVGLEWHVVVTSTGADLSRWRYTVLLDRVTYSDRAIHLTVGNDGIRPPEDANGSDGQ